jgi:stage II sporulation protein E
MGYGEEAKVRSKMAIDLFKKYIDIGFNVKKCIRSLNNVLKEGYSKEGYTTFDLFVFDKLDNKFYFSKNGACDSYVLRGEEVLIIEGNDLPLGIVDKVESNVHSIEVKDNDYIVMASDGVSESCFRKCKSKDPSRMVKEIIERQKDIVDDASVLVINIKKREY